MYVQHRLSTFGAFDHRLSGAYSHINPAHLRVHERESHRGVYPPLPGRCERRLSRLGGLCSRHS